MKFAAKTLYNKALVTIMWMSKIQHIDSLRG